MRNVEAIDKTVWDRHKIATEKLCALLSDIIRKTLVAETEQESLEKDFWQKPTSDSSYGIGYWIHGN